MFRRYRPRHARRRRPNHLVRVAFVVALFTPVLGGCTLGTP